MQIATEIARVAVTSGGMNGLIISHVPNSVGSVIRGSGGGALNAQASIIMNMMNEGEMKTDNLYDITVAVRGRRIGIMKMRGMVHATSGAVVDSFKIIRKNT